MKAEVNGKKREGGARMLLSVACVVIVIAGLKASAEICVPIAMGLFLGILSLPILDFLNVRCRVPRWLAVVLTLLFALLLIGGIVFVVSGVIPEFIDKRVEYAEKLKEQAGIISEKIDEQLEKLASLAAVFGNELDPEREHTIPTFKEHFNQYWDTERVVTLIGQIDVVERFTSIASKSFFVLILMTFVLAESQRYARKALDVVRQRGPNLRRFANSSRDIQRYLLLKTAISLFTGLLAWVGCSLMNIDFPVLWGLVAFILNFVPVIGSILAAIPPVVLALILQGYWPAIMIFVIYLGINVAIGNFLEPKLLGDSFGISTIVVILSVLIWGYIWGPAGMFLAVPLTMIVKVMLDNTDDLRWLSVLISAGGDDSKSTVKAQKKSPVTRKKKVSTEKAVS